VAPLVGITAIALWVITIFLTRRSALAALIATVLLPFYAYFLSGFSLMVWSFAISSLVIYKHKDNISRLCQGTESRIDLFTQKNPR
jgi:glycerol-3-phosphate acyltransferase PlsY